KISASWIWPRSVSRQRPAAACASCIPWNRAPTDWIRRSSTCEASEAWCIRPDGDTMLSRLDLLAQIDHAQHQAAHGQLSAILVIRLLRQRDFRIDFGYEAAEKAVPAAARLIESVLRPKDQ